uniref:GRAM domain containing 1C n=1 Tax=Leptobrachium leishanense TaxID=445787 RepID=A0A8C5MTU6_9ANUR
TYKQRSEEFRRLFKELAECEKLIVDYACALQRDILLQGRLYLSENYICFHSNIFRWETSICLNLRDITSMTKEKTARLIPNAIQISTENEKLFFTSFAARDRSFLIMFRMWQNVLLDKSLTKKEFWHLVQQSYGTELGLNNEEMESISLPSEDNVQPQPRVAGRSTYEDAVEKIDRTSRGGSLTRDGVSQTEADGPSINFLQMVRKDVKGPEPEIDGRLYINRVYHISSERMFQLLFTPSRFMQRFLDSRKVFDLEYTPWQSDGNGNQTRTLTYTITLNNPLIGKFTTATDTQTSFKEGQEGQSYFVQTEVFTHDVPYHDYFFSVHKYFITRTSKHKCRLRVCSNLKYKKQPWGLVKTFIERNSWSGLDDYFKQLDNGLQMEETANPSASDIGKSSTIRRRRRLHNSSTGDPPASHATQDDLSDLGLYNRDERTGGIQSLHSCYTLVMLVVLNLTLFFKLSKIEHAAQSFYHIHHQPYSSDVDGQDQKRKVMGPAVRGALQDSITTLEQVMSPMTLLHPLHLSTRSV